MTDEKLGIDDRDDMVLQLRMFIGLSHDENGELDDGELIQRLVIYIIERDGKVWDHAYALGKAKRGKGVKS